MSFGTARSRTAAFLAIPALFAGHAALAQSSDVKDFYQGKSMTLVVSTGVGGGYDANARVIGRHIEKHIPGKPSIVVKNMPGAGHVRAANFLYTQAPQDGSHLGMVGNPVPLHQVLKGKGVQYDASKFNWLGASERTNINLYVMASTGIKSLADAMDKEVILGGTGVGGGNVLYPALLNNTLGTKFRVIIGYKTGAPIHLAMERGEVQGRAGNLFTSLLSTNPQWVKNGTINILLQIGLEPEPGFEKVPLLIDLAKDEKQKRIFRLYSSNISLGRPMLTTPGVPMERVSALRKAFDATMVDDDFRSEAEKAKMGYSPVTGIKLQQIVQDMIDTPDEVVEAAIKARDVSSVVRKKN